MGEEIQNLFQLYTSLHLGFQIGDLEDRVIIDVMGAVVLPQRVLPQRRYTEGFMLISFLEVCQKWVSRRGKLGGHLGFLNGDLEDMVINDTIDALGRP